MKKLLLVITVLIGVSAFFYLSRSGYDGNDVRSYKTAIVKRDTLSLFVGATGVVTPSIEVEVKSKAGGEIIRFSYEEGDILKKGEVAVRLDPDTETSRVNQANASLLIAEARLEKAKITLRDEELRLKRQKSLYEDNVISRQDLDNVILAVNRAGSDVKIAEAELIRAIETLKEAKDRLEDTEIRAPLSGTVLKKYVEEGQVIASTTSSVSEGTLLFTMADLNRIYVEAMVDETDIGRVRPGQEVMMTVDAYPEKTFEGTVVRIAPKGRVESTVTVFDVTVEVSDEDKRMLKPMMTANAEILIERKEKVLLLPLEAVRKKENQTGVYKASEGEPVWVNISTGSNDTMLTEIEGDISEGEEVIISGFEGALHSSDRSRDLRRGFWFFGRKK